MRKLSRFLFLLLFIGTTSIKAQKTIIYSNDSKDFNQALSLYKAKQYATAQHIFDNVKATTSNEEIQSDCSFYSASSAIHTNQSNADVLMKNFISDFPTSIKQNQAFIDLAHYYFEQSNYSQALYWFDKVD